MSSASPESSAKPATFPGKPVNIDDRAEMLDVLTKAYKALERRQLPLRIPPEDGQLQKFREKHFHFMPEVFLQMKGTTEFEFPRGRMVVKPGEMCVIPAGVPHGESITTDEQGAFRNLVVGFYSHTLSLHFAHEVAPGKPDIQVIEFFDAPNLDLYIALTNHLVTTYHTMAPARVEIIRGLLFSLLGMFMNLVETGVGNLNKDIGKVFMVKWLVREQIANPKLNVKNIAERLQCSPDYLSHLFHAETGEKLIHYIQRIRVKGALLALETTKLYISEIAWSSGYQDPAYFARVFKKFTGESPQQFRERLEGKRKKEAEAPKTIYFDRDDFSHGTPAPGRSPESI